MSRIWENIEDKKDFISRPYTKQEEAMIQDFIASGKEYKKVDVPMEEYIKNYVPKQLDIFKVDL